MVYRSWFEHLASLTIPASHAQIVALLACHICPVCCVYCNNIAWRLLSTCDLGLCPLQGSLQASSRSTSQMPVNTELAHVVEVSSGPGLTSWFTRRDSRITKGSAMSLSRSMHAWLALRAVSRCGLPFPAELLQGVSKYSRSLCASAAAASPPSEVSAIELHLVASLLICT